LTRRRENLEERNRWEKLGGDGTETVVLKVLDWRYCSPVPGGYKYGDLALQVEGDSRIGTIKYRLEPHGTQTQ
jgi:hypothetical protein